MNIEMVSKLLASENISVVQKSVPTAYFDLENRNLVLPEWKDMETFTYDHLIGHEVGHAIYTDKGEWFSALEGKKNGFKTFLNVVEDARIEKKVQSRFPGLRKSFIKSYRKMLDEGFFGGSIEDINKMKLIDRLNVYFKCGMTSGVVFSSDEVIWVKRMKEVSLFSEVVDLAKDLYEAAIKEKEEEQKNQQQMEEEESEEESFGLSDSFDDSEDDEESEDGSSDGSEDEESEDDESEDVDVESFTDKNLESMIRSELSSNSNTINIFFEEEVAPVIMGYKEYLKTFKSDIEFCNNSSIINGAINKKFYDEFLLNNKAAISYMIKEFEMKKRATEYKRTTISKTGTLDTVKMNNYRWSDDVFLKMDVTNDGKNHGLIMYLDWSSSMWNQMSGTIQQLLNLVSFCRSVQIPFRVYAFTSFFKKARCFVVHKENETAIFNNLTLVELFNDKMKKSEFIESATNLIGVTKQQMNLSSFNLGGTPLDAALIAAPVIHETFVAETKVDVVNTIILTDGVSHRACFYSNDSLKNIEENRCSYEKWFLNDRKTKKRYLVTENVTEVLLRRLRDRTQSNVIGFYITPNNKKTFVRDNYSRFKMDSYKIFEEIREKKFAIVENCGYNRYFFIGGGSDLETANNQIDVEDGASKRKISGAFKRMNSGRKSSRIILSKFIEMIA